MESTDNKAITEKEEPLETVENQVEELSAKDDNEVIMDYFSLELTDLINHLKSVVEKAPTTDVKNEVETIKVAFYKKHKAIVEKQKRDFVEQGGDEEAFVPQSSDIDEIFKELLNEYKKIKAAQKEAEDKIIAENLEKKQSIIEQLNSLIESNADINETISEFRRLTQEWRNIGKVAPEFANEIWKRYNILQEKFYDLIKINNELREYDFKKNLEQKTVLCEKAEALDNEKNIISAFQQLQLLHEEWKNIGPVAKELRESIWERFKVASGIINKKHQQYFEDIKAKEKENLSKKILLCEAVENTDLTSLSTFKQWDEASEHILKLQEEWKSIGFAPRKDNVKIYERFRTACNNFYKQKSLFFKTLKDDFSNNLKQKEALCEQVEKLKDSTNWNETTKKITDLQKEWKNIGQVQKKYSDAVWKRFSEACDYFFQQRNEALKSKKEEENSNLAAKKDLIERLKNCVLTGNDDNDLSTIQAFEKEWNEIGHIPFKVKDKIFDEYKNALNSLYAKIKKTDKKARNILSMNRNQLLRLYNTLQNEIKTYENNIGFFANSKKANKVVADLQHKIERLKKEVEDIVKRIEELDEQ
ncbi:MAG: DUF349 domain-containing protein [Paludibacteraceae bacterium]|nr:DUF349 domain-containing protein [Paludibacteraceae bacterium]